MLTAKPRGGCVYCTYETPNSTPRVHQVAPATQVVVTARGPRDLCDRHAESKTTRSLAVARPC